MREIRVPRLGVNYGAGLGAWTGTPTKIVPPSQNIANGKIPEQAFGAQWQNYIEDLHRRQIERSAQLPLRNFLEISARPTIDINTRACYSYYAGITFFATGANNSVQYVQDLVEDAGSNAARTYTVAPAAGTFVAKGCEIDDNDEDNVKLLLVGSNSTAPTKTFWSVAFGTGAAVATELTSPVSGSIELIVADRSGSSLEGALSGSDVDHYAFAADTNRSVLKRDRSTGAWSVIGTRGAGAPAPSATTMRAAVGAGTLMLTYVSTDSIVETMSTAGGFSSATVTTLDAAPTGVPLDARYSVPLAQFLVLNADGWVYRFVTPGGSVRVDAGTMGFGAVTDTGTVTGYPGASGFGNRIRIASYFGDIKQNFGFGALDDNTTKLEAIVYDGAAIWVTTIRSGARRCFRSLRG